MKTISRIFSILVVLALLASCTPPPPEKIVETVTVIETVVVEGAPVVQEKIITATPLPPKDKVTLRLNWSYYGIHAAFIYGIEKGIYDKYNIDLTVKQGNGSSNAVKLVANKDSDFAYASNGALISNMVGGAPVIAVMSIDAMGTDAVLCRPDSGIKEFKDLKGLWCMKS